MTTEPIILNKNQYIAIRKDIIKRMNNRQEFLFKTALTLYARLQRYKNPTIVEALYEVEAIHSIESVDETNLVVNSLFDSDLTKPTRNDFLFFNNKVFFICEDNCCIEFLTRHNSFIIENLKLSDVMNKERTFLNKVLTDVFRGRH